MTERQALKRFGKRVRALRLERGWTQERLAEAADLHENYISRLETGEQEPGLFVILRLCRAFDIPAGTLLDGCSISAASQVTKRTRSKRF